MGQKVSPIGLRIGINKDWEAKWYANNKDFSKCLESDMAIRKFLDKRLKDASISKVEIERNNKKTEVTIHTSKPGVIIGRGGEEIEKIIIKHNETPHLRIAQKTLAKEFITDLHGEEEFNKALKISECLFQGKINELKEDEVEDAFKGVPSFKINLNEIILDTLVNNKIEVSRREAREFLNNNSITVNGNIINDENTIVNEDLLLHKKYLIIRKGKKKYFVGK